MNEQLSVKATDRELVIYCREPSLWRWHGLSDLLLDVPERESNTTLTVLYYVFIVIALAHIIALNMK